MLYLSNFDDWWSSPKSINISLVFSDVSVVPYAHALKSLLMFSPSPLFPCVAVLCFVSHLSLQHHSQSEGLLTRGGEGRGWRAHPCLGAAVTCLRDFCMHPHISLWCGGIRPCFAVFFPLPHVPFPIRTKYLVSLSLTYFWVQTRRISCVMKCSAFNGLFLNPLFNDWNIVYYSSGILLLFFFVIQGLFRNFKMHKINSFPCLSIDMFSSLLYFGIRYPSFIILLFTIWRISFVADVGGTIVSSSAPFHWGLCAGHFTKHFLHISHSVPTTDWEAGALITLVL